MNAVGNYAKVSKIRAQKQTSAGKEASHGETRGKVAQHTLMQDYRMHKFLKNSESKRNDQNKKTNEYTSGKLGTYIQTKRGWNGEKFNSNSIIRHNKTRKWMKYMDISNMS